MSDSNDSAPVWVIDLDGVIWLGDRAIPGAAEAVATLQARGTPVVFATNNSSLTRAGNEAKSGPAWNRRRRRGGQLGDGRRHVGRARRDSVGVWR